MEKSRRAKSTHTHTEVKAQNKRRQKQGKGGKNFRVAAPKIQKKNQ